MDQIRKKTNWKIAVKFWKVKYENQEKKKQTNAKQEKIRPDKINGGKARKTILIVQINP